MLTCYQSRVTVRDAHATRPLATTTDPAKSLTLPLPTLHPLSQPAYLSIYRTMWLTDMQSQFPLLPPSHHSFKSLRVLRNRRRADLVRCTLHAPRCHTLI